MRHRYLLADVFTDRMFGGNQLAVFPDAREIPDEYMQKIAREFNLSETVFVLPPRDTGNTKRLRIFTPGAELPFAGHPTVGTACVLAAIGAVEIHDAASIVFEEGVGPVPVHIKKEAGEYSATFTAARLPESGPPPPSNDILAQILSIASEDILSGVMEPQAFSCGLPYLFVPVRDRGVLARMKFNTYLSGQHLAKYWTPQVYVFALDPELAGSHVRSRMFAPELGIVEDPATGSAAAALAGYLGSRDKTKDGILHWQIEQGFEMGRPSILQLEATKANGKIAAVRVGGQSVMVGEGMLTLP